MVDNESGFVDNENKQIRLVGFRRQFLWMRRYGLKVTR